MSSQNVSREQTCDVRLKIHCKGCEKKLKKWLLAINGVRQATFVKDGLLSISGTIEPSTLLMMLENYGVEAEILSQPQCSEIRPYANNVNEILAHFNNKVINPLNDIDDIITSTSTVLLAKTVKFGIRDEFEQIRDELPLSVWGFPFVVPSAPPLPENYYLSPVQASLPPPSLPPSWTNPFYTVFNDDNTSSCIIM